MKGFLIGHEDNGVTGVSAVIAPAGAVAGVSVRGGAPGTRETDLLRPENAMEKINAAVISGGSAFGLEAADGVMRYLYEKGIGYPTATQVVPIVCGAVIFDLLPGELNHPDKKMGYAAAAKASEDVPRSGRVGAGKGATTGKIMAPAGIDRGGVGYHEQSYGKIFVAALTVVNALGDVFDKNPSNIVAGARLPDGGFLRTADALLSGKFFEPKQGENTTVSVVMTNAAVTKAQANKLADISHDGLALSISPVHTMYDGDTVFAMSTGEEQFDFNMLCIAAVEAVRRSIVNAVTA